MQRVYDGVHARLVIDAHGALWLSVCGDDYPVPFVYTAGLHSVVLPFQAASDLGPEAYGRFALDAAAIGIAVLPEIPRRAVAEWQVEEQEQEP